MRVLVCAASRHGSTVAIAERVGAVLREHSVGRSDGTFGPPVGARWPWCRSRAGPMVGSEPGGGL